ncbi:MAG: DNA-directed RNA polymerase subunit beta' [Candidatus Campbellbacteria bacterium]|nr:DNA-directed RNA polymerase subunit beta' [Candidatus Campbellbacteria bacterium]
METFDTVGIKLASPEKIAEWSHGEVTKPETINYRTQRSEKNGLFDERIFGPERDFECYCGKYKGIRYKGIVCEKCGVEITRSIVRRERMGHLTLATPVAHIWFVRNVPSRIGLILNITGQDLEKVIYFAGYIIISISESERELLLKNLDNEYRVKTKALKDDKSKEKLKEVYLATKREINSITKYAVLDEATYAKFTMKYGTLFEAGIGAEAVYELLKEIDLEEIATTIEATIDDAGAEEKKKMRKRLSLIRSMLKSKIRPEWMFLINIPIIPAALRPMVALDGGRHATSDLNDLYRRVINRNNRLKKLLEIHAPSVILRNEKRILQEAVDALIDNSMRHSGGTAAVSQSQRRPLKSLSDNLKGKQGIFRQNLLGKRVDYSGRSVIVVGPTLKLDECGLPKQMALELFRPFVISKLIDRGHAYNIRGAGRLIDDAGPEVWGILEEVIAGKYVLLNRAPTLHRLGIQAFRPILIEGQAIQIHPLVVQAYNADFDGDQMAVHLPLSDEAQLEAKEIMSSGTNILRPGSGTPIVSLGHQDIVLGSYWMTRIIPKELGEGGFFASPNDAILAYDFKILSLRAKITVRPTDGERYKNFKGKAFETSVGRLLFNASLPTSYPFINKEITKKEMAELVNILFATYTKSEIMSILDKVKHVGFTYATKSGTTFSLSDVPTPSGKQELIDAARVIIEKNASQYEEGLLSDEEKFRKDIEVWHGVRTDMEKIVAESLDQSGPVYTMWKSGARGQIGQITNMAGIKGLIAGSQGRTIDFPILSSSKEGLSPIEYFITTNGARKGLGDTALNTAQSGYLTRRLFDVAQDVVVTEDDCSTKEGILLVAQNLAGIEISLAKNITGRFLAKELKTTSGDVLFKRGELVTAEVAEVIEKEGITEAWVRSPMSCETSRGVCQKCYGNDLGTAAPIVLGEAVGTIAAQSIGEPATQLTMRTFHAGGAAAVAGDIVAGLPRVQEIFERRPPKNPAIISEVSGTVVEIVERGQEKIIRILPNAEDAKNDKAVEYVAPFRRTPIVKEGDTIEKGQLLTDGSADLAELFKHAGRERSQSYIIDEISKIYELQGASVSRKHIEIIIKQMFSRVQVKDPGDTDLPRGSVIEMSQARDANTIAKDTGGKEAKVIPLVLGITNVALSRASFLSAASFQHTNKVLIDAGVRGKKDDLRGLKENIIVGRLIPAGTGFPGSPKWQMIQDAQQGIENSYEQESE